MKLLVDECTGPAVARWLEQQGHDVFSVYDQARGIDDDRVLEIAHVEFANDARTTASFFFIWLTNVRPIRFACLINCLISTATRCQIVS